VICGAGNPLPAVACVRSGRIKRKRKGKGRYGESVASPSKEGGRSPKAREGKCRKRRRGRKKRKRPSKHNDGRSAKKRRGRREGGGGRPNTPIEKRRKREGGGKKKKVGSQDPFNRHLEHPCQGGGGREMQKKT